MSKKISALVLGLVAAAILWAVPAGAAQKATTITVTEGTPEFAIKVSTKTVKAGVVTFKVTNKGLGFHTFKFCTTPVKTAAKNTCVGKVTKTLKPGQSASFTVTIKKAGKYEFLCSIPGHAAGGMKGLMGFGVAVTPVPTTPTTTSGGGGGGGGGGTTTAGTGTTANGCPAGTPPGTTIGSDEDGDESDAVGKDDADGCL